MHRFAYMYSDLLQISRHDCGTIRCTVELTCPDPTWCVTAWLHEFQKDLLAHLHAYPAIIIDANTAFQVNWCHATNPYKNYPKSKSPYV